MVSQDCGLVADACTTGCMCLNSVCSLEGRKGTCLVPLKGSRVLWNAIMWRHRATGRIPSGTWRRRRSCLRSFIQVDKQFAVTADDRDTEILWRPVKTISWCSPTYCGMIAGMLSHHDGVKSVRSKHVSDSIHFNRPTDASSPARALFLLLISRARGPVVWLAYMQLAVSEPFQLQAFSHVSDRPGSFTAYEVVTLKLLHSREPVDSWKSAVRPSWIYRRSFFLPLYKYCTIPPKVWCAAI